MKLLILGGTKFLGRHLVDIALERGHDVSIFHRGQTNPDLFPSVETLHGDRDGNLTVLAGKHWDAVIDTSGYVPRIVQQSVDLLKQLAPHYTFISSISVYPDFPYAGMDETYRVDELPEDAKETEDRVKYYGPLKALCEQVVQAGYGDQALIIRPGLIVGPHDPTDRFTYWPHRFAQGGEVLVPGTPNRMIEFIDARDLSAWTLDMVERRAQGVYNATGLIPPVTMGQLVETCVEVAAKRGVLSSPVWVDDPFLKEHEVGDWIELPLWLSAQAGWPGFMEVSIARAHANGLRFRSVTDTVEDTLRWDETRPQAPLQAGLDAQKETGLLQSWNEHRNG